MGLFSRFLVEALHDGRRAACGVRIWIVGSTESRSPRSRITIRANAMPPLTSSNQSCGTPRSIAALPPINDQTRGMTSSERGTDLRVSSSIPKLKIVTGHGVTPNIGMAG